MERLHSALERYKKEERPRSVPSPAAFKLTPLRPVKDAVQDIVYTQTRSIDIPDEVLRERRVLAGFQKGPFLDAYKILRTQVMHRLRENGWNVLGITSPNRQEGKTLAAVNLAISLAMDTTQTVLLVDADFTNPSAHLAFGLEDCGGLVDYLLDSPRRAITHSSWNRQVRAHAGGPCHSKLDRGLDLAENVVASRRIQTSLSISHRTV